jgi:hypothetical protein
MNPDEILSDYEKKLGKDFGTAYYYARNEWCFISITWKQFQSLFCSNPERVELMNSAGASFFYTVDKLFFEAILLAICRLSDPIKTGKKSNLTIKLLQKFMSTEAQGNRLTQLLVAVENTTEFARDWRNRYIGHNDFSLMCEGAEPLQTATIAQISEAINAIHQVLNFIENEFMRADLAPEVIDTLNNEMVMLERLYLGEMVHHQHEEEILKGNYKPLDIPRWLENP